MTLGSTPQPADVVAELGKTLPYTFQKTDPAPWWLADLATSSPIVFPTSFANKQSIKQVDITALSALGTSHSFAGVNFGTDFSGRMIIAKVFAITKQSAVTAGWTLANGLVGGQPDAGTGGMAYYQGGNPSTVFTGTATVRAQPTGTSGTISFDTGSQTRCMCVVLSIAGSTLTNTDFQSSGFNPATGGSISLNIPANGVLLCGCLKANTNSISLSGVTLRGQQSPLAGYQIAWGWDNRMSSEAGHSVSYTSTGSAGGAIGANSRVQG